MISQFIKRKLRLLPLADPSEDTKRIYEKTRESCDHLNMYYEDFLQSYSILSEKKEKQSPIEEDSRDIEESLMFMEGQINNISRAMEIIAEEMNSLVKLEEE